MHRTQMTPTVVTDDCIPQQICYFYRTTVNQNRFWYFGDETGSLGEATIPFQTPPKVTQSQASCFVCTVQCVSKNDTDVAHYNFDADQPILIIFGRDVAETACYQAVICYPTSPN